VKQRLSWAEIQLDLDSPPFSEVKTGVDIELRKQDGSTSIGTLVALVAQNDWPTTAILLSVDTSFVIDAASLRIGNVRGRLVQIKTFN
jgi:hypothetical protein